MRESFAFDLLIIDGIFRYFHSFPLLTCCLIQPTLLHQMRIYLPPPPLPSYLSVANPCNYKKLMLYCFPSTTKRRVNRQNVVNSGVNAGVRETPPPAAVVAPSDLLSVHRRLLLASSCCRQSVVLPACVMFRRDVFYSLMQSETATT